MLVLERGVNESILIGDSIVVKVLRADKGSVKLGIIAPKDICIVRTELIKTDCSSTDVSIDDDERCLD
ncbi:MAG: carbon storage regulator [Patescibacteria group bacterium]|nr:MAG: carbon storage regulator [Patescibacteria group bacterium]